MNITEIKVYPVEKGDSPLRAFVRITIDDEFVIRDLKVIDGKSGLFVAMPSRRDRTGIYRDIAHPISQKMRGALEDLVLQRYHEAIEHGRVYPPDDSYDNMV